MPSDAAPKPSMPPPKMKRAHDSYVKFKSSFEAIFVLGEQAHPTDMPRARRLGRTERNIVTEFISGLLSKSQPETKTLTKRLEKGLMDAHRNLKEVSGAQFCAMLKRLIEFQDIDVLSERTEVEERIKLLQANQHLLEEQKRRATSESSASSRKGNIIGRISSFASGLSVPTWTGNAEQRLTGLEQQLTKELAELVILNEIHERVERAHSRVDKCRQEWQELTNDIWDPRVRVIAEFLPTDTIDPKDKIRIAETFTSLHDVLVRVLSEMSELVKEVNEKYGPGRAINTDIAIFTQEVAKASRTLRTLYESALDTVNEIHKEMVRREMHKLVACFSAQLSRTDKVVSRWVEYMDTPTVEQELETSFLVDIKVLSKHSLKFDRESRTCCQQIRTVLTDTEKVTEKRSRGPGSLSPSTKSLLVVLPEVPSDLDKSEEHFAAIAEFCNDFAFDLGHYIRCRSQESLGGSTPLYNPFTANKDTATDARRVIETEAIRFERLIDSNAV